jgi:hypothetical protein
MRGRTKRNVAAMTPMARAPPMICRLRERRGEAFVGISAGAASAFVGISAGVDSSAILADAIRE